MNIINKRGRYDIANGENFACIHIKNKKDQKIKFGGHRLKMIVYLHDLERKYHNFLTIIACSVKFVTCDSISPSPLSLFDCRRICVVISNSASFLYFRSDVS